MQIIHIYWRDIPAQVIARHGRVRGRAALGSRFQEAIDRTAMRVGKGGSTAYLEEWRRETNSLPKSLLLKNQPRRTAADLTAIARAEAETIESRYSDADLAHLVARGGLAETSDVPG